MTDKYDLIIIGSGCGGAAAAALGAFHGYKTLVLEKNKIVGGRCSTHEIRGFKLDHGHMISRGAKGPHGEVLRLVNCKDLIPRFAPASKMPQKLAILDKTFYLPGGDLKNFPVLNFLRAVKSFGFSFSDWIGFAKLFFKMSTMSEKKTRELNHVDMHTFLSKYTDNIYANSIFSAIAAVSFGALSDEASAGELIRAWRTSLKENSAGYPVTGEGVSAIPKSFLRAAEKFGAKIMLHTPVDRIVVKNNIVKGVEIKGKLIASDMVISNAGIRETVLGLVGEAHFADKYVKKIKNLKYSYGGLSLKYALDKSVIDFHQAMKMPENFDQNMRDALEGRIPEENSMMLVCSSNIDPRLAPDGKQTLMVISPGPVAEPGKIKWKKWVEHLKKQVEDFAPQIKGHVLFCIVSTPDVIAKESGRTFGDAVGVAQTTDQVGKNAPSSISPVKGLYYAGADVGSSGIATEMATQSAIDLFAYFNNKD